MLPSCQPRTFFWSKTAVLAHLLGNVVQLTSDLWRFGRVPSVGITTFLGSGLMSLIRKDPRLKAMFRGAQHLNSTNTMWTSTAGSTGCSPALLESCGALSGEDTGCRSRLPGTIGCSILLADAIDWMPKPPEMAVLTVSAVPAGTVSLDAVEDPIGNAVLSDAKCGLTLLTAAL